MLCRELDVRPHPQCIARQKEVKESMRCVAVDWLHDVAIEFEMELVSLHS